MNKKTCEKDDNNNNGEREKTSRGRFTLVNRYRYTAPVYKKDSKNKEIEKNL